MKQGFSGRLKRQTLTVALSAAVIAAVILLNVFTSLLCSSNRWFIDMTAGHYKAEKRPEYQGLYTLTDQAKDLLGMTIEQVNSTRPEGEDVTVDIIFCADADLICRNDNMRYIYYTAMEMQKAFPDTVKVSTIDVWSNPSAVNAYRANTYSKIYQTSVIVASGSEFRVYSQRSFFTYDEDTSSDPWAYSGEKTFIKGILAVTKADAPIACLTTNHGEPFGDSERAAEYTVFVDLLENAGYEVRLLDLYREEIPENCRLIVTLDPVTDFVTNFKDATAVSEIRKLDDFLAKSYSFMVLADADTPKLKNLEEFLEEWGIAFDRYENTSGQEIPGVVQDASAALDGKGMTFSAVYEELALGGSVTQDLRDNAGSPTIVFSNSIGISYSETYERAYGKTDEDATVSDYKFGYYSKNNVSREIYDIFRTTDMAVTYEKNTDNVLRTANAQTLFSLMTLSRENRYIGEGQGYTNVNDVSYVCALGSTYFVSNDVLSSNAYGNADMLLSLFRVIGREIEPVGLKFKPFYSEEVDADTLASSNVTAYPVVLALLPALAFAASGTVVLVKRKYRR